MSAPMLMVTATFLFATMAVCVKLASASYSAAEIVFYRGLVGVVAIAVLARWRGIALATTVPAQHAWRAISGVAALVLWFYAIANLPLATAMTLNYMSSVWMALLLVGGSVAAGSRRIDTRLIATVLVGFAGVALVLRPTVDDHQLWHGLAGLGSGLLAALAYLQVTTLGRAGEPEARIVFYFSIGGMAAGAVAMAATGATAHTPRGLALLLAIGVLATSAQMLMTRAYAIGRTLVNAALQYLGIVFSFVYGVLLFGDPVPALAVAGMLLIVGAGLAATRLRAQAGAEARSPLPTDP